MLRQSLSSALLLCGELTKAGFTVSDKSTVTAQPQSLAVRLSQALERAGFDVPAVDVAECLGVTSTAGRRRHTAKQSSRVGKSSQRAAKAGVLRKISKRAAVLLKTGVRPQGQFGITVQGAAPTTRDRLRSSAAKVAVLQASNLAPTPA